MNLSRFSRNCFKHTSYLDGMVYAHEFRYGTFTPRKSMTYVLMIAIRSN